MSKIPGVDVSQWQGPINWKHTRLAGAEFAFIKATDGGNFIDPQFKLNWRGAKEAGLLRGAYHFFRNSVDPITQAGLFVKTIQLMGDGWGELPMVIDCEDKGTVVAFMAARVMNALHLSRPAMPYLKDKDLDGDLDVITTVKPSVEQVARKFCDAVASMTNGEPVMVYTNLAWAQTYLKDPSWMQYPLWVANYVRTAPAVPNPWLPGMQKVWQVEASPYGAYYGASSPKIDRDVMDYDGNY